MDTNNTLTIEQWNKELVKVLIPNDIILSFYILAGVIGNGLVIIVYGFRINRKQREERYFIPYLAVNDMVASVICSLVGITSNLMQTNFTNQYLCKTMAVSSAFATYCSIFLLLTIAVNRYRKICRPLGPQITLLWKRLAMVLSCIIAFVLAFPLAFPYGSVPFPNEDNSLIGFRCSKLKEENNTGSLVYGVILTLLAVMVIISLISIYMIIGRAILQHTNFKKLLESQRYYGKNNTNAPLGSSGDGISSTDMYSDVSSGVYNTIHSKTNKTPSADDKADDNSQSKCNRDNSENTEHDESIEGQTTPNSYEAGMKGKPKGLRKARKRRRLHRFTLIYMLITCIFLICYIPKVILLVIEGLNPYFWEGFSHPERAAVLFVYRMYIINNVANPIIYGFLDVQFRKEVKKFFKCY